MSDTDPTVPAPQTSDGAPAPRRAASGPYRLTARSSAPRLVMIAVVTALVVGIPVALISHQASKYYIFSPGTAPLITDSSRCKVVDGSLTLPDGRPCVRLIVPPDKAHTLTGKLFMVDVLQGVTTPWQWVEWKLGLLGTSREVAPISAYLGPFPQSEAGCQDAQEMSQANQYSALAALSVLRYKVKKIGLGAQVSGVVGNSPAWDAGLRCNDVITKVNGTKIANITQMAHVLNNVGRAASVQLTYRPPNGAVTTVKVKLRATPYQASNGLFPSLDVQAQTLSRSVLPFKVSVDAGDIGGPSAGLAFTLAILDTLSNGKLTGGHRVAATGTIDPSGDVGDVGGVREKTAAVQAAGAQVFFVPKVEYAHARDAAKPGLAIIPVTTLRQVLEVLHSRFGGDLSGVNLKSRS